MGKKIIRNTSISRKNVIVLSLLILGAINLNISDPQDGTYPLDLGGINFNKSTGDPPFQINSSHFPRGSSSGTGTLEDPIVYENLIIDASYRTGLTITGYETLQSFIIIRNCTFFNGSSQRNNGLKVNYCANVNITNNTFVNTYVGILVINSTKISITNNTITNNSVGVFLSDAYFNAHCENVTIRNNTFSDNKFGIRVQETSLLEIHDNFLRSQRTGIYLSNVDDGNFTGNRMENGGVRFDTFASWFSGIWMDTTNKVDNKSIYFLKTELGSFYQIMKT